LADLERTRGVSQSLQDAIHAGPDFQCLDLPPL